MRIPVQVLVILLSISFGVNAAVLNIPGDYDKIQDAVDQAQPLDTVLVADGIYHEQVIAWEVPITLASLFLLDGDSSHISQTIIHPDDSTRYQSALRMALADGDTSRVCGLTFTGGHLDRMGHNDSTRYGGGIYTHGGTAWIEHCIIRDNVARMGGGIYLDDANGIITNCIVDNNRMTAGGAGIHMELSEHASKSLYSASITRSSITRNEPYSINDINNSGGGILITGNRNVHCDIIDNTITDNNAFEMGGGVLVGINTGNGTAASTCTMTGNTIHNNGACAFGGVGIAGDIVELSFLNNNVTQNLAAREWGSGIGLLNSPENPSYEIAGNHFVENKGTIGGAVLSFANARIHDNIFMNNQGRTISAIIFWTNPADTGKVLYVERNIFYGQQFDTEQPDKYIAAVSPASDNIYLHLHQNDFINNQSYASGLHTIAHQRHPGVLYAENNYWGHASGPYHPEENPEGLGDTVRSNISILPFLTEPATAPHSIKPIFPENNAAISPEKNTFSWTAAIDLTTMTPLTYTLELSEEPGFSNTRTIPAGQDTSVVVEQVDPDRKYYWRVYAEDSFGLRGYSKTATFVTSSSIANTRSATSTHQ